MSPPEPREDHVAPPLEVHGQVELVEWDQAWARLYAVEEARVRAALGATALQVEHVGSTSVPGLAAKPIIDMMLLVASPADEEDYVPALTAEDYYLHLREPEWYEHRLLRRREPTVHLHVFPPDCMEVRRVLAFRDHLRRDEQDRLLYERTKRELAARDWTFMQEYADAKTTVVEDILARAMAGGR